ncbi:terpene synthase family protein [Dactylosporangium sp. NPDC005572]|uniref:terpene synthase family protein n=1 Tax=Dactylosporangium sp. NPDC005572 TaxID=3156889 RepID=UPI0033B995E6
MITDADLAAPVGRTTAAPEADEFYLPPLPRLLPVAYHPQAAQIEISSNGWIRRMLGECFSDEQALLVFLRQRNGIYGPITVPFADRRRAQNIADWYQFVTVIDSFVSDESALGADHSAAREAFAAVMADVDAPGGAAAATVYGRAAQDLWRRIAPDLSRRQVDRLVHSLEAFLRGCAAEIEAKLAGTVPDFEGCMRVRMNSFGCEFLELLTEYACQVDMSDLAVRGALDEVHHHGMRQLILVNDLLSWRKEYAQRDTMTTMRVLREHEGLGLQQAVDRLCALVAHHEHQYISARDAALAGPSGREPGLSAYLSGLDHLIGGSQEFEYLTPRYFGDGAAWDGTTYGWLSLTAPVARFRPGPSTTTR